MKIFFIILLSIILYSCQLEDQDNHEIYTNTKNSLKCWSSVEGYKNMGEKILNSEGDIYLVEGAYSSPGVLATISTVESFNFKKYNQCGTIQFEENLYDNVGKNSVGLAKDSDNDFYISLGSTTSIELLKYDKFGSQKWKKSKSFNSTVYPSQSVLDNEGNIMIISDIEGTYISMNTWTVESIGDNLGDANKWGGQRNVFIQKYDGTGNLLWTHQLSADNSSEDRGWSLAIDENNNIYATGATTGSFAGTSNSGNSDTFIAKFDENGNRLWVKLYGTSGNDYYYNQILYHSGYLYLVGNTDGDIDGLATNYTSGTYLMKIDSNGSQIWNKIISDKSLGHGSFQGYSLMTDNDGNLVVGTTDSSSSSNSLILFKYTTSGEKIFEKTIDSGSNDTLRDLTIDNENNIFISGSTEGSFTGKMNFGTSNLFILKLNSSGEIQ